MPFLTITEYVSCEYCNSFKIRIPHANREEMLASHVSRVKKHESSCWFNPANETCMSCASRKKVSKAGQVRGYNCDTRSPHSEDLVFSAGRVIKVAFKCPDWDGDKECERQTITESTT